MWIKWLLICIPLLAQARFTQESVFVLDSQRSYLGHIQKSRHLSVDHPTKDGYELYGPTGLKKWLSNSNIKFIDLDQHHESFARVNNYPKSKDITRKMLELEKQYPSILKVIQIGKSHRGQPLLFMKISDHVRFDEKEPEVKYIANMHGNEIVGREMMIALITDIAKNYGKNKFITNLVNNTEIFIMPSMNPDGADIGRRGNANNIDLNRDFPDFTTNDSQNAPKNRALETKAIMSFQAGRHFSLSANFHGGAVCVNYPWDTLASKFPLYDTVINLSLEYASRVPEMANSTAFEHGITNGFEWYEVNGGMQDWSYHWHNDMQVTIELSGQKWPDYSTIPSYYKDNRVSMLYYLMRVHQGVGIRTKSKNFQRGSVSIINAKGKFLGTFNYSNGEFYKVLAPGNYHLKVIGQGRSVKQFKVKVKDPKKYRLRTNGNYIKFKI